MGRRSGFLGANRRLPANIKIPENHFNQWPSGIPFSKDAGKRFRRPNAVPYYFLPVGRKPTFFITLDRVRYAIREAFSAFSV